MYKSFAQFILSVQHVQQQTTNLFHISLRFQNFQIVIYLQALRKEFTYRMYAQWHLTVRFVVKLTFVWRT